MEDDGHAAAALPESELLVVAAAIFTFLRSVTSDRPPGLDPPKEMMKKELRIGSSLFDAMVPCGKKLARMDDEQLIRATSQVKNQDEVCGMVEGLLTLIGATVPPPEGHLVPESTFPLPEGQTCGGAGL